MVEPSAALGTEDRRQSYELLTEKTEDRRQTTEDSPMDSLRRRGTMDDGGWKAEGISNIEQGISNVEVGGRQELGVRRGRGRWNFESKIFWKCSVQQRVKWYNENCPWMVC